MYIDISGLQKTGDRGVLDAAVNLENDEAEEIGEEGKQLLEGV